MILLLLIFIVCLFSFINTQDAPVNELLIPGKCKGLWRPDSLPGKCFGVNPTKEFDDLKEIKITNYKDCRSLCCNLKERCVTWQYQNSTETCFIQKEAVRLGFEGADTPLYCDPFPPNAWNGNRLKERKDGKCEWGDALPNQCFAFGPERITGGKYKLDQSSTEGRLNAEQCRDACCADNECDSWQEMPGRGCYFGKSDCKKGNVDGGYEGGRKCIPKFCGGMEDTILKKYHDMQKSHP